MSDNYVNPESDLCIRINQVIFYILLLVNKSYVQTQTNKMSLTNKYCVCFQNLIYSVALSHRSPLLFNNYKKKTPLNFTVTLSDVVLHHHEHAP